MDTDTQTPAQPTTTPATDSTVDTTQAPTTMTEEVDTTTPTTTDAPLTEVTEVKDVTADNPTYTEEATADKQVQEASATLNVTQDASKPGSANSSKIIIGLMIAAVLAVMGVLGYYLFTKISSNSTPQTNVDVTPAPTVAALSPTPKNEQEEVDKLDTTFPETEMDAIQTDLQGL